MLVSYFMMVARDWDSVTNKKINKDAYVLMLTRKGGNTLTIGDEITVTVLGTKGNQVRIGISAPKDVAVLREEVRKRMQAGVIMERE